MCCLVDFQLFHLHDGRNMLLQHRDDCLWTTSAGQLSALSPHFSVQDICYSQLPSLCFTFCSRLAPRVMDSKCKFPFVALRSLTVHKSPDLVVSAMNFWCSCSELLFHLALRRQELVRYLRATMAMSAQLRCLQPLQLQELKLIISTTARFGLYTSQMKCPAPCDITTLFRIPQCWTQNVLEAVCSSEKTHFSETKRMFFTAVIYS